MKSFEQVLDEWTPQRAKEYVLSSDREWWRMTSQYGCLLATYLQEEGYNQFGVQRDFVWIRERENGSGKGYPIPQWYIDFSLSFNTTPIDSDREVRRNELLGRLEGYMVLTEAERERRME